jgi:hypothetical protein
MATLCVPLLLFSYPAAYSKGQRLAAERGYLAGLEARITDVVFVKKVFVATIAFAIFVGVMSLVGYYLSLLLERPRRQGGR